MAVNGRTVCQFVTIRTYWPPGFDELPKKFGKTTVAYVFYGARIFNKKIEFDRIIIELYVK